MSQASRNELAVFVGQSVEPSTMAAYQAHWAQWKTFLWDEFRVADPLLSGLEELEKTEMVALFVKHRHERGFRGKGAHCVTSSIRLHFNLSFQSTSCLDSPLIKAARSACRSTPLELREAKDAEVRNPVKLPFCWELIEDMRRRLWFGKAWSGTGLADRMVYLACVWGYDQSARVSEYTQREGKGADHSVRVHDLAFTYDEGNGPQHVTGGHPFFLRVRNESHLTNMISECRVMGVTSKGKRVVKPKVIARRSAEESRFLTDLVLFISHSGTVGSEELFSIRVSEKVLSVLRRKVVREAMKITCDIKELPRDMFSSHSLRKAAISDMRMLGSTEADRRDRGGFSVKSPVMNDTYDYGTGLGPLACQSLTGGCQPDVASLRKLLPANRGASEAMPQV